MIASYNNYPGGYALKALHQAGKNILIYLFIANVVLSEFEMTINLGYHNR